MSYCMLSLANKTAQYVAGNVHINDGSRTIINNAGPAATSAPGATPTQREVVVVKGQYDVTARLLAD